MSVSWLLRIAKRVCCANTVAVSRREGGICESLWTWLSGHSFSTCSRATQPTVWHSGLCIATLSSVAVVLNANTCMSKCLLGIRMLRETTVL